MREAPIITKRLRKNFGKIRKIVDTPNLISVQRDSYARFLQLDAPSDKRLAMGLQAVFKSVFPIKDFTGSASLEFVSYRFMEPKHTERECRQRGMTYELPLRITVRLVVYDVDKETGDSNIRDIKEQESYFGTIPLMTERGTFIVNGTERVVVSQLHRSSGVFFDHDKGSVHSSGKVIYSSRIIPVRGSWIDMEVDPKDIVYIRIDRRRKFPATLLFKAFGYSEEDILKYFYKTEKIVVRGGRYFKTFKDALYCLESFKGKRASADIEDPETGEMIVQRGKMFTRRTIKRIRQSSLEMIPVEREDILGQALPFGVKDPGTGEMILRSTERLDEKALEMFEELGIAEFDLIHADAAAMSASILKTLVLDKVETNEEALIEIFRRLRPGNPVTPEVARDFLDHMFFKSSYYDLSSVGRLKMNLRLGINSAGDLRILRKEDILLAAKTLVDIRDTQGAVDDIDHLGNRRVRAVGELLENQYRIGLVRMERAIKERMSLQEVDALMPHDLLNPKPVSAVVKEFFGTSQLSQFMDQTNPLSETTHKRRLSALGPGGLTRERAGFEVRDVHPSHYGRICPIETPEGPNIGLIVSLSTYARVNDYGFIETPFSVVKDSTVTPEVKFLSAFEEKSHPIAQANAPLDEDRKYQNELVTSRVEGELMIVKREEIEFMDISPNQLVSVSASLIPFLENDDANRALMGSNMQRQAVPLMVASAPVVGTGMEGVVARDSGVTVVARRDGTVASVDASRIVVEHDPEDGGDDMESLVTIYNLTKFMRSNQNTCVNQRPVVAEGQKVKAGEVIADGPATDRGELALGQNVTVAFMPWGGYNFEDSILVSERLVRDGVYTSGQIEEFEMVARDTKLGREEITRDIPNVGDEALKDLDESGIIRLGADVKPGDILIGKITPKGETQLSPEEKLLRAIFGEKAGEVKDASLRVPPGVEGIVIDAKVFTRRGAEKDDRTLEIEAQEIDAFGKDRDDEIKVITEMARRRLEKILSGKKALSPLLYKGKTVVGQGEEIRAEVIRSVPVTVFDDIAMESGEDAEGVFEVIRLYKKHLDVCQAAFSKHVERFSKGDDLPPGVIKMVKVYVAMKRKLSVGDKMAGRHGNKGVVSRILPQEDMPYFENGEPVDVVLNPLGVPSRMNVGQILEVHLGRAAKLLGDQISALAQAGKFDALREKFKRIFSSEDQNSGIDRLSDEQLAQASTDYKDGVFMATPVFDGAKEPEIKNLLEEAGVETTGQTTLCDGRTGQPFDEKITVGTMYILKLHHLVDDKIHARSIGPYSLVTQQPLGGKAQFGGQRLGEMEVWAMEGYGAAYALQEFLTVKSDDMAGRTRMYEKIVKGQNVLEPGLPESFKVLIKELQSLGLSLNLLESKSR
ncbi:RNA polymerase, beta subunit [Candidatus Desulfarcum epimagneticum]|uniref:DNA-directed RNA polymerase subunit beta n=1 Tax=uncultured Desulfobacteraceae bacterium TaxID=218296 RepID=A0A484HI14_9BACT|nr:RNA polymerase, beta subunit [uncultured Desulfobacteraceae bacterium]